MDEVPFYLEMNSKKTLEKRGTKKILIKGTDTNKNC
jgi:hypothetical protein